MSEGMTPTLIAALRECARYNDEIRRVYWWRTASMKKLALMGLVEAYQPFKGRKAIAYCITDAGRSALSQSERGEQGNG